MKVYIHNDHDGRSAGNILFNLIGPHNFEPEDFIELNYDRKIPIDIIAKDEKIFFLDYSFGDIGIEQLKYIYDNITQDITWIDHHATSKDMIKKYLWINKSKIKVFVQEGICGAGLIYLYLKNLLSVTPLTFGDNENIPKYLRLIDDYDCWKLKMIPESSYLKLAIECYPHKATDSIWTNLLKANNNELLDSLIKDGAIIKKHIDVMNTSYRESKGYESEIDGHKCFVINISSNSWVFGDLINKYDVLVLWCFDGEKYNYSIYSEKKNINCKDIATKFGGGGHPGASGFTSDKLILQKIG
ncbi:MAG: DHHA1 domain-containing protein [Bacilli bacterium]